MVTPSLDERQPSQLDQEDDESQDNETTDTDATETATKAIDSSLWDVDAVDLGVNRSFESVGGTSVDLVGGTFLITHELILDGSGGASELSLPGLIYDSSTVHVDGKQVPVIQAQITKPTGSDAPTSLNASLVWFDHVTSTEHKTDSNFQLDWANDVGVIAMPFDGIPTQTGLYDWTLTINAGSLEVVTHGQTPVVVNQGDDAIFGDGWALAGVPTLTLDRYDGGDSHSRARNPDGFDDRLILSFPGSEPILFDYSDLTVADLPMPMILPSILPGSRTDGLERKGFADPQEYGTLTARTNDAPQDPNKPDELVYTAPDGTEYIFYRWEDGDQIKYLLNRIEQPGIDFDPTVNIYDADPNSTDRQGVSFKRDAATGRLFEIVASDGGVTKVNYSGDKVETLVFGSGSAQRVVELTINGTELQEIRHRNAAPTDFSDAVESDSLRAFTYDSGRVATDKWMSGTTVEREKTFAYDAWGLASIQLGGHGADENSIKYNVNASIIGTLKNSPSTRTGQALSPGRARVFTDVHDLEKLDASGAVVGSGGIQETWYDHNIRNQTTAVSEYFDSTFLAQTQFTYDAIGSTKTTRDVFSEAETQYRYDYEIPVASGDGDRKYDDDDYRGNVTHLVTPGLTHTFVYETDDNEDDAVGQLLKSVVDSDGVSRLETIYERAKDGRVLKLTRPNGYEETWHYNADFGLLAWHQDANGLKTTFDTYSNSRLSESTATDDYTGGGNSVTAIETETSFDSFGMVDEVKVRHNNVLHSVNDFDFDRNGNLSRHWVHNGDSVAIIENSFEYASDERQIASIDADGVRSETHIDKAGLVTSTIVAAGETFSPHFGGGTQQLQQETLFAYYKDGSVRQRTLADGTLQQTYYDPTNLTTWETIDGVAGESNISSGTVQIVQDKVQTIKTILDHSGRVVSTENLLTGSKTAAEYADARVDLPTTITSTYVKSIDPADHTTTTDDAIETFVYDGFGNILTATNAAGVASKNSYDAANQLKSTQIDSQYGQKLEYTYTAGGYLETVKEHRRSAESTPPPLVTTYVYDESGRVRQVIDPLNREVGVNPASVDYVLDGDGFRVTSTSRVGAETIQWFDAAGNLVKQRNPLHGTTSYTYNPTGTVDTIEYVPGTVGDTSKQHQTTFSYDALNRARSQTVADTSGSTNPPTPITSYTDYFLPSDTTVGWDVASTDGAGNTTAAVVDSIGQPIVNVGAAVGRADTSANVHPVTLIAYDYNAGENHVKQTNLLTAGHIGSGQIAADAVYDERRQTTSYHAANGPVLLSETELRVGDSVSSAGNLATLAEYDALNRPVTTTRIDAIAGNAVTTNTYDDTASGTGLLASVQVIGQPTQSRFYTRDSAGNLLRLTDNPDASLATIVQTWTHDALSRPLTHDELVNQVDASGNKMNALQNSTRHWTYQGLATNYQDRTGQITTTTFAHGAAPTITETTTHADLGTFTATTFLNADGSVRKAEQTVTGLDPTDSIQPSTSTVSLAYDAFGRQIRDTQDSTLDCNTTPEIKMEYAHYASGALEKIVRKIDSDRVTETTFGRDGMGNATSILDNLLADTAATSHWVNDDPGDTRYIEFSFNIDSTIDELTRNISSSASGADRGHTDFGYRSDGYLASVHNQRSVGNYPISVSSKEFNSGGSLDQKATRFYDDSFAAFVDETYDYEYSGGRVDDVIFTDVAANTAPHHQPISQTSGGSVPAGSITGYANRVYQEPITNGDRFYQYDLEGRVTERKDVTSHTEGNVAKFILNRTRNTWDHRNRLVQVERYYEVKTAEPDDMTVAFNTTSVESTTDFFYDAFDRRIGKREVQPAQNGNLAQTEVTAIAYDQTGKAFETVLFEGDFVIERNYLNSPAGVLAIDQGDYRNNTAIKPTLTTWLFNDVDGSATTIATVHPTGQWESIQRRFSGDGLIHQTLGDTNISQLMDVPAIWHGAEINFPWASNSHQDTLGYTYNGQGSDSFDDNFRSAFGAYVDPATSWNDGTISGTVIGGTQYVGYTAMAGLGAFAAPLVLASSGASAGVVGLASAGSTLGVAGGLASTYASNPNAGFGSYALGGGLGGAFGGYMPGMAGAGLASGSTFALGAWAMNADSQSIRNAYLIGDIVGGIGKVGLDDAYRLARLGLGAGQIVAHAGGRAAITSGVAFGGGYAAYSMNGGDMQNALFWANMSSMPGGMVAKLLPCFPAGTPILTPEGSKPIEQLRAGDLVLSRDEHDVDGDVSPKVIEEAFVRHGEIWELVYDDGTEDGRCIEVTPEHPVYVRGRGWTPAGEVQAGDEVSTIGLLRGAESHAIAVDELFAGDICKSVQETDTVTLSQTDSIPHTSAWSCVMSNGSTGRFEMVYNFRVAEWATYFVGEKAWNECIWVHNSYSTKVLSFRARHGIAESVGTKYTVSYARQTGSTQGAYGVSPNLVDEIESVGARYRVSQRMFDRLKEQFGFGGPVLSHAEHASIRRLWLQNGKKPLGEIELLTDRPLCPIPGGCMKNLHKVLDQYGVTKATVIQGRQTGQRVLVGTPSQPFRIK